MSLSEAKKRANDKYLEKLERVYIRVPKGYKETIQKHADTRGESVNSFVTRAIRETIERDTKES